MRLGISNQDVWDIASLPRKGHCSFRVKFTDIHFLDSEGRISNPRSGGSLVIRLTFKCLEKIKGCRFSIGIFDIYGSQLMTLPTYAVSNDYTFDAGEHQIDCTLEKLPLTVGIYKVGIWCGEPNEVFDCIDSLLQMDVEDDDYYGNGLRIASNLNGKVVLQDYSWEVFK